MPKSKQDWLEQGLWLLVDRGDEALTIDELTNRMSLTKGSFYHHFQGIRQYRHELAAYWMQQQVSAIPVLARKSAHRVDAMDAWVEEQILQGKGAETSIRAWGQADELVRSLLVRLDTARRMFIVLVLEVPASDRDERFLMADMLLSMLAGSLSAASGFTRERALELYAEYKRLYGLDEKQSREQQMRLPL